MPENDQLQQNNFVQNQQHIEETTQQIIQQNNIEGVQQNLQQTTENQVQKTKERPAWLNIILSVIFGLLGIGSIILILYYFFSYDWSHDLEDYAELGIRIIISILIIFVGVLTYCNSKVEAYYHPTWLTKILSGIFRFLGILLIRSGFLNFLLIPSEYYSNGEILLDGGSIILCGIGFIVLGILLYCTKKLVNMGVTFLLSIAISIGFNWILDEFGHNFYRDYEEEINISLIIFMSYFLILSIIWGIRCFRLKKRGKINGKILNKESSNKEIGYITTCILFLFVIINLIYGKIQWSKIPEIDPSIFNRDYHQNKLSDEEDALIQLRNHNNGEMDYIFYPLESYYHYEFLDNSNYLENNKNISRKQHPEECLVINSGGNEYCGTWVWNKETLNRSLNNYFYIGYSSSMINFIDDDGYLSIDGKRITIFEYLNMIEPEMRTIYKELDRIASLNYYLPDDDILNLIPPSLQGFSRASMIALQYYIYQEDWDMVMFIIKLNYKFIDMFSDSGSFVNQLISLSIQGYVDDVINSYIELFPKDFKNELSDRYSTQIHDKNEIIDKMWKGEYVLRRWAKNGGINGEIGSYIPSLSQIYFHFPFISEKDTDKLMNYSYYLMWKGDNIIDNTDIVDKIINNYSLYNTYGKYVYYALIPRLQSVYDRIDRALYHKEVIVKNLKSEKITVWFSEYDYEYNYTEFEKKRIPTFKEINKDVIKEYSDIINPCFGKDIIGSYNDLESYTIVLRNKCSEALSKINEQEDDRFGLKEILAEMTQLRIDDFDNFINRDNCSFVGGGDSGDFCQEMSLANGEEIRKLMEVSDNKFLEVLENIKSEIKEINIDEYFYTEYLYNNESKINNIEINNENIDGIEFNDPELIKTIEEINKYSNIVEPCFGKDIIDPKYSVGYYHDEFEEVCLKTLSNLKEQENNSFGLKEILIEITKSLINYSKFEVKVDACWLEEGVVPNLCDEIFNKEEELVDKIKENYIKLSNILKNIKNENPGINMDKYFYIPNEKIYNENNLTIISFIVD